MEIGKYLRFIFVLTGIIMIPVFSMEAYYDKTTHPALTKEIIELFNYQYPDLKLSGDDFDKVILGSMEEDLNIRPLNHFYDPIHKEGLNGLGLSMLSAKEWSQNTKTQAGFSNLAGIGFTKELFSAGSDYSWERAIYDYVHNDKERALESLGHILHLIQDMSVPPHTRNDDHLTGRDDSPYEIYTKNFNQENIRDISGILKNEKEILFDNLDSYFDSLANFTNRNFFSKDTLDNEIRGKRFIEPIIDFEKEDIVLGINFGYKKVFKNIYKLTSIETISGKKEDVKSYSIEVEGDLILQDYWKILSEQAVLHGAGVMKLFFDEVEKEKETLALLEKNKSAFQKFTKNIEKGFDKLTNSISNSFVNVNKKVAKIDRRDLVASAGIGAEGFVEQSPSIVNENNQPKPEDPNSPELQRLKLILNEAEKITGRLEKDIINVEKIEEQNISENVKDLNLTNNNIELTEQIKETVSEKETISEIDIKKIVDEPKKIIITSINSGGAGQSTISILEEIKEDILEISPPKINNPADFSQIFNSTTITFSGTASSSQIIYTDFSTATTTVQNDNTWELILSNFPQATTTINFYAKNNQNNSSEATIKTLFVDSEGPDTPSLEITQCNNSMLENTCLISETNLNVLWEFIGSDSEFNYFNIDKNGIFSTTTATSTQIANLNDGDEYIFSIASVDNNGNSSATSTQIVNINQMPIIINEIAWAGTDASAYDEWIELYNRSDENINLENWMLYSQDGSLNIDFSNATDKIIEANNYYLIERTDDTTVNDISADYITPFGSGLENSGGDLILAYKKNEQATTTVDQASFGNGWVYIDGKRTLERYDHNSVGNDTDNWDLSVDYTSSFDLLNGEDANSGRIDGTPKARNSINYKIAKDGVLRTDKTITKINSPYVVVSDGLNISSGKTLTIEEGVVIKSVRSGSSDVIINGILDVNGTQNEPVIFTTVYDDEGGDTNGDGDCVSGTNCSGDANNYWSQLILVNGSTGSEFDYTTFKYGGYPLEITYPKAMIVLDNTQVNFNNIIVENSYSSGISLNTATSTISNSTIQNNHKRQFEDNEDFYGIYALKGKVNVSNSTFDNNQIGVGLFDTLESSVTDNIFTNHEGFPLIMNGSAGFVLFENTGSENDKDGIHVSGYITKLGFNTTLNKNTLPYLVETGINIMNGTSLSIEAGSVFKFKDNNYLDIYGELDIKGTSANPVIFTSVYDDSDGVDVYGDGLMATSSIPKKGGLNLKSATSTIDYAEFKYLDKATAYYNTYGVQSPINLSDVVYSYNTWSIFADEQSASVNRNDNVEFIGEQSMSSLDNW